MSDTKAGPIIGGIIGVIVLVGISIKLLLPGSASLSQQVDAYLDREKDETPATRFNGYHGKIDDVETLLNDPEFTKLPVKKQELLRVHLRELRAYQDYEARLDRITPPRDASSEEQLRAIEKSLVSLTAPAEFRQDLSQTEAGQRRFQWQGDVRSLESALKDVRESYQKLNEERKLLLKDPETSGLRSRAVKILDKAGALPAPETHQAQTIPGSSEVTYAAVFRFASVLEAYREWEQNKKTLKDLTSIKLPKSP